ncbi:MAG: hypothetical protein ABIP74_00800 [Candidatus Saccharimonas sp.]
MKQRIVAVIMAILIASVGFAVPQAEAVSLKIAPLRYQAILVKNEKKKGFVDISNPSAQPLHLKFEVEAFRQINDQGDIEFYDNAAVSAGVLLDLDSIELGPREALRLYFVIDGTKLPLGEVFAAVLARTVPGAKEGAAQSVRVGTILEITNGQAGSRSASISAFSAPFFQIGEQVSAHFEVKNDATIAQGGGFHPDVTFSVNPYSTQNVQGPLVFAGHARTVDYKTSGNYFGFVWLQVGVGNSSRGTLAFVMIGYWRWLGPMIIFAALSLLVALRHTLHKKH